MKSEQAPDIGFKVDLPQPDRVAIDEAKRTLVFRNTEGRETALEIVKECKMGGGAWGDIYAVEARLGSRVLNFVLKRFNPQAEVRISDPREAALAAFKTYGMAKNAGLKVFTTYRLGDDERSILMTNAELEDAVCIGTNTYVERDDSESGVVNLEYKGYEPLHGIVNFDTLLKNLFEEAEKARLAHIALPWDCFFFLVNPTTNEVNFVIGDLDLVERSLLQSQNNKAKVYTALQDFVENNLSKDKVRDYMDRIESYYKKLEERKEVS